MAPVIARNPTRGEVEAAADVAHAAFPYLSHEHWQDSFRTIARMFGERFILVGELDGQIVSTLVCCPAPILIGGAEVTHSSVGAVGTLPGYRRMGCAAALMAESVTLLRDEGIHTSSLWPFSYPYYRRFGWELAGENRHNKAEGRVFMGLGDATRARAARPDDFAGISECYREFARRYNCCTVRTDEWWHKIARLPDDLRMTTDLGRGVVVHTRGDGGVDGYVVYDIEQGAADNETGERSRWIDVKEVVYTVPEERRHMLALIGSVAPELAMSFFAPADDTFMQEVPDPEAVKVSLVPSFQFRVTDPEGAIGSLTPRTCKPGRLTFRISDPVLKRGWEFGVVFEGGQVALCEPDDSRVLDTSVQTFAKLLSGYLTPACAFSIGHMRCTDQRAIADAHALFSSMPPLRSQLEPG